MTPNQLKTVVPLLLALPLIGTGTDLQAYPPEPEARTDRHGDPLPPGALARMGTVRLRHGGLNALTFSADGKSVTSVGTDRVVRVWDVASGRQVRTSAGPPGLSVFSHVAFSADGKLLALPGSRSLRVWDVARAEERGSAPRKGNAPFVLALSPDGRTLVEAGDGDSLQLWYVDPLREHRLLKHDRYIHQAAFSADGKVIGATSTFRGALRLWDVESGKELLRIDTKDQALAFSPDGKTLASVGRGRTATLWDARTGAERGQLALPDHDPLYTIPCVAFSPDGKTLAAGGDGRPIVLWDAATRKELHQLPVGRATLMAFSPDGSVLASGATRALRLWDVGSGRELHPHDAHTGEVNAVAVSPDGKLLASGSWEDYTIRLWDRATGRPLHLLTGHTAYVRAVAFTPDGKALVSGGGDGMLRLWDTASGKELRKFTITAGPGGLPQVLTLGLSLDGKTLAAIGPGTAAGPGYTYWAWDLAREGEPVKHELGAVSAAHVFLAPDARTVALANGNRVILQDVASGKGRELHGDQNLDSPLAFSRDGKLLAARATAPGTEKEGVALWSLPDGKSLLTLEGAAAGLLAISPDGRYVAAADPTGFRLFEVATGHEVLRRPRPEAFTGQHGQAFASSLAFTPDGAALATGLLDTTVLLWDLAPERGPALKRDDLNRLWSDLTDDGPRGYAAVWSLARGPAETVVAFLKERLKPVAVDATQVRKLILDLDSDEFAVRERALKVLEGLGEEARPLFREALAGKPSAEVRTRLEDLLVRDPRVLGSGEGLRGVRAVEVLERVGTPAARQLLTDLKGGAAEARLTREARAALERFAVYTLREGR